MDGLAPFIGPERRAPGKAKAPSGSGGALGLLLCRCHQHAHAQDTLPKGFMVTVVRLIIEPDMHR
jgi:hypothetical protein